MMAAGSETGRETELPPHAHHYSVVKACKGSPSDPEEVRHELTSRWYLPDHHAGTDDACAGSDD